jgi:hypothetical protein
VEPLPWPDVNRRVAPQGKEGASPGAKGVPVPDDAKPQSKGSGGQ